MRDRLIELEKTSRLLEPAAADREAVRSPVVNYAENFLDNIERVNAYNPPGDKGIGLLDAAISETGIGIDEAISLIRENVDTPGLNPASDSHFGYIPGCSIYFFALAHSLADFFRR